MNCTSGIILCACRPAELNEHFITIITTMIIVVFVFIVIAVVVELKLQVAYHSAGINSKRNQKHFPLLL